MTVTGFSKGNGVVITGHNNTVKRVTATANREHGIHIRPSTSGTFVNNVIISQCTIYNNYKGIVVDYTGGITISDSVVYFNVMDGIHVNGSRGVLVESNLLGRVPGSLFLFSNFQHGLYVSNCQDVNVINNTMSGNWNAGCIVEDTTDVRIENNRIGVGLSGYNAVFNFDGIRAERSSNVTVKNNIMSGNSDDGCYIGDSDSIAIIDNQIGVDGMGMNAIPNAYGIFASYSTNLLVSNNIISGNSNRGIILLQSSTITITDNKIGVDRFAKTAIPNDDGLVITTSYNILVRNNVISGNLDKGCLVQFESTNITIESNLIGVNGLGNLAIPNFLGLFTHSTSTMLLENNTMSGNLNAGLQIQESENVTVLENRIGVDFVAEMAVPNGYGLMTFTSSNVLARNNVISGNRNWGYSLSQCFNITIETNLVGVNGLGNRAIPNWIGLRIGNTFTAVVKNNVISGNEKLGLFILDCKGVDVENNPIGVDSSGTEPVPNIGGGIGLSDVSDVMIANNILSGNGLFGCQALRCVNLTVEFNQVGVDISGAKVIPNDFGITFSTGWGLIIRGNLISGNTLNGCSLSGVHYSTISGNYFGVDRTGKLPLSAPSTSAIPLEQKGLNAVMLTDSFHNMIGGTVPQHRNIISAKLSAVMLSNSFYNHILGNFIGTDASGTYSLHPGGSLFGVSLHNNSDTNFVSENIISGHETAVSIDNSHRNVLSHNDIGVDQSGTIALGNEVGIRVTSFSSSTIIRNNVISGNVDSGIRLLSGAHNTTIESNFIGTDRTGTQAVPNLVNGVGLINPVSSIVITNNTISGNLQHGMDLSGVNATVCGNKIGTDSSGLNSIPNGIGVYLNRLSYSSIGCLTGEPNIIAGNTVSGIDARRAINVNIQGNFIGINQKGQEPMDNEIGIVVQEDAQYMDIQYNVIGDNFGRCCEIRGDNNVLRGNMIGLDPTGFHAMSRFDLSVSITGKHVHVEDNIINGRVSVLNSHATIIRNILGLARDGVSSLSGAQINLGILLWNSDNSVVVNNTISEKFGSGIYIMASNCSVLDNRIGTDITGTIAKGQMIYGINVRSGANNSISHNVISGNQRSGISLEHPSSHTTVSHNIIGLDITGTKSLGNGKHGIHIVSSHGNVVGPGNVLSGNAQDGCRIAADGTMIFGNYIGTDLMGEHPMGNGESGIRVDRGVGTVIGPPAITSILDSMGLVHVANLSNVIGFNSQSSILFAELSSKSICFQNIFMGTQSNAIISVETPAYRFPELRLVTPFLITGKLVASHSGVAISEIFASISCTPSEGNRLVSVGIIHEAVNEASPLLFEWNLARHNVTLPSWANGVVLSTTLLPSMLMSGTSTCTLIDKGSSDACVRCTCNSETETVNCEGKGLPFIPSNIPPETKRLLLSDNSIFTVPRSSLDNLPNLQYLDLARNNLGDDAIIELNSISESLIWFSVAENRLKILPFKITGLPVLTFLNVSHNPLQRLEITESSHLRDLHVNYCMLTNILESPQFASKLPKLRTLELDGNLIPRVPPRAFGQNSELEFLVLSNNRISDIPDDAFRGLESIRTIDLRDQLTPDGVPLELISGLQLQGLKQLQALQWPHSDSCPAGSAQAITENPSTVCLPCPVGSYKAAGPGRLEACDACLLGTTDDDADSATPCIPCDQGTYVPKESSGSCSLFRCNRGYYDDDKNPTTPCLPCPAGTLDITGDGVSCDTCGPGHFISEGRFGQCQEFECSSGTVDEDNDPSTECVGVSNTNLAIWIVTGSMLVLLLLLGFLYRRYAAKKSREHKWMPSVTWFWPGSGRCCLGPWTTYLDGWTTLNTAAGDEAIGNPETPVMVRNFNSNEANKEANHIYTNIETKLKYCHLELTQLQLVYNYAKLTAFNKHVEFLMSMKAYPHRVKPERFPEESEARQVLELLDGRALRKSDSDLAVEKQSMGNFYLMWHGISNITAEDVWPKIARNGMLNLRSTASYFGSGVYLTSNPLYAFAYSTGRFEQRPRAGMRGTLVLCAVYAHAVYPISRKNDYNEEGLSVFCNPDGDERMPDHARDLMPGSDAHYAVVNHRTDYQATTDLSSAGNLDEMVVKPESVLPLFCANVSFPSTRNLDDDLNNTPRDIYYRDLPNGATSETSVNQVQIEDAQKAGDYILDLNGPQSNDSPKTTLIESSDV